MVIKDRLVKTSIHILRLISDKNLNINKIIKQTSSDRSHVIEAIMTLERAKLVKRRKSKSHKQVEFLVLAQMGSNLVNFMNSIDEFRRSFQSLTKTIDEYFNLEEHYVIMKETLRKYSEEETGIAQKPSEELRTSENSLRNKLRTRYWTDKEIDSHFMWADDASKFHLGSAQAFIMGLFNKYLSLSLRRGSTEISRAMLTEKVINSLNQHVYDVYKHLHEVNAKAKDLHDKDSDSAYIWLVFSFNRQIKDYLELFSEEDTVRSNAALPPTFNFVPRINNRFLQKEVKEVMRSITHMYEFDYRWPRDL